MASIISQYKQMAAKRKPDGSKGDDRTGSVSFGKSIKPNKNTPKTAKKVVKPVAKVVKKSVKKK